MTMTKKSPPPIVWVDEDDAYMEICRSIGTSYVTDVDPVYHAALASGEVQTQEGERGKNVHLPDLRKWLTGQKPAAGTGGPKRQPYWPRLTAEMVRYIQTEGKPVPQSKMTNHLLDWFNKNIVATSNLTISKSTVKTYVSEICKALPKK